MNAWIFSIIWPRFKYSAACERSFGIIHSLLKTGWNIKCFSGQSLKTKESNDLRSYLDLQGIQIDPNHLLHTRHTLSTQSSPDIVIFDSFVAEEQFSHYIHSLYPNALKILDLQDLHCLRKQRQQIVEQKGQGWLEEGVLLGQEVMRVGLDIQQEPYTQRELASIKRMDLILTCSDYEQRLLHTLGIYNTQLITFFYGE